MIITPVEDEKPIRTDFYSVAGSGIPPDAVMEFSTSVGVKTIVKPTFIRPHLALVAQLPNDIRLGAATLRLTSPSKPPSNALAVTVEEGPAKTIRVLQPGEDKDRPYTIVFVANPRIATEFSAVRDPILDNRSGYHDVVGHCLCNLFTVEEDLFRNENIDAQMRLVSVFDETPPAGVERSLCKQVEKSNMMETQQEEIKRFVEAYRVRRLHPDVVFVIHGSTTHTRASAWYTKDDAAGAGTPYTFDRVTRRHGHFPKYPGTVAIPVLMKKNWLTVIHEFGHAASDFHNGMVADLYHDRDGEFFKINKKFRTAPTDTVPSNFAEYNDKTFNADARRDGLGYEGPTDAAPGSKSPWRSYHPEPMDPTRPNLMDDYKRDDRRLCRFDKLTYDFLRDRLNAKLSR